MIVVALDLSTRTGWAVLKDGKLVKYGLIVTEVKSFPIPYPSNLCAAAQSISHDIARVIGEYLRIAQETKERFEVAIEDTNLGANSQRYAQKILEFIHCTVISRCLEMKVIPSFVNSHAWRSATGVSMSDQDKQKNNSIDDAKSQQIAAMKARVKEQIDRKYNPLYAKCTTKKELKELAAKAKAEHKELETYFLKGIRAPAGKVTYKHLSVARVNKIFGRNFQHADNDICDAILIGLSRFAGTISQVVEPTQSTNAPSDQQSPRTEGVE